MLRGFYTAASGMKTQARVQETLANNIANANTPGYKADQAAVRSFPEMLLNEMGTKQLPVRNSVALPNHRPIGSINTGVYVQETIPNFHQGDIKETNMATDFAIVHGNLPDPSGALFFSVQNDQGEVRYTRNGNFTVDGAGNLVTGQGYYVLDQAGNPIQLAGTEFTLHPNGMIETATGNVQLGIAYTDNPNEFTKEGNDVFNGQAGAVPAGATFSVKQGYLEQSNVDAIQTMTEMMNAYRLFETNQRVLRAYDESLGKAVSEVGRLG